MLTLLKEIWEKNRIYSYQTWGEGILPLKLQKNNFLTMQEAEMLDYVNPTKRNNKRENKLGLSCAKLRPGYTSYPLVLGS